MTGKEFIHSVAKGKSDIIQALLDILAETSSDYCLIGGLAVNAYVEPVVSLDLGIVATVRDVETIMSAAKERGFRIENFEHSVNLSSEASNLRIQIQTDPPYQEFIPDAQTRDVLGYQMKVAKLGRRAPRKNLGLHGQGAEEKQETKGFGGYLAHHRSVSGAHRCLAANS